MIIWYIILVPEVFHKDLSILSRFFSALSLENENIRISVQEALSNMVEVYKLDMINNNPENIKIIESILEENIDKVWYYYYYYYIVLFKLY